MSYLQKIKQKYMIVSSHDISDFDPYDVDVEIKGFSPSNEGSATEPASGHTVIVRLNSVTYDVDKDNDDLFNEIKVGNRLKVNLQGETDLPSKWQDENTDSVQYEFKEITVTNVKREGNTVTFQCRETSSVQGRPPAQSYRNRN